MDYKQAPNKTVSHVADGDNEPLIAEDTTTPCHPRLTRRPAVLLHQFLDHFEDGNSVSPTH